ncbi:uncharacterized protein N7498_010922 [Penicillium cinerascens]|uniref:Uncharacterized protein n=1 Tax=Penicillium cinerascens TaxID=70096 RepID=A0A9W9J9C1_9EURO|nr:uncharacterized protein N7498_010922 [Penicillium cinerascens]KAJ5191937.1 hypothetical protein N7498_010922 [Penicillium cinerascens]
MTDKVSLTFPLVLLSLSFAFTAYLNRQAISHTLKAGSNFLYRCIQPSEKKARRMVRRIVHRIRRCIVRRRQLGKDTGYELVDMSGNTVAVSMLDDAELEYPSDSESCSDGTYSTNSTDRTYSSSHGHDTVPDSASNDSRDGEISPRYPSRSTHMASTRISSSGLINISPKIMPMEWEVEHARRMQQGGPSTWLHRVVDWTVERLQANFEAGNEISEFDRAPYINVHNGSGEQASSEHIE